MGGLSPFTTFLNPYKSYENVEPKPISWITEKGTFLFICHDYENPMNAYSIKIIISNTPNEYVPITVTLGEAGMNISIGWANTLQFINKPAHNISVKTYRLV